MNRPVYPNEVTRRSGAEGGAPVYASRLVLVEGSLYRLEVESFGQRWRAAPVEPLVASDLEWRSLEVHQAIAALALRRSSSPEDIAAELAALVRTGVEFEKAVVELGILPAGRG